MKALAMLAALPVFFASPALAQHQHGQHGAPPAQQAPQQQTPAVEDHSAHEQAQPEQPGEEAPAMEMMWPTAPPVGNEPPPEAPSDHAADNVFDPSVMQRAREQLQREHGGAVVSQVMLNLFEYQLGEDDGGYRWDGEAWIGGDINRLVLKTEGEGDEEELESGELQVLYSRAISPYFDVQAGVRHDFEPSPTRTYATVGVEGVAPYWFELDAALFLSDHGELSARAEGSYDVRLTQRLILQPRAEVTLAAEDIPELGVGSGLSEAELGLRLRYEIRREFAPYIGVTLDQKYGDTADFARAAGEDTSDGRVVIGLRAWF
jgi:copper resistance protein B